MTVVKVLYVVGISSNILPPFCPHPGWIMTSWHAREKHFLPTASNGITKKKIHLTSLPIPYTILLRFDEMLQISSKGWALLDDSTNNRENLGMLLLFYDNEENPFLGFKIELTNSLKRIKDSFTYLTNYLGFKIKWINSLIRIRDSFTYKPIQYTRNILQS